MKCIKCGTIMKHTYTFELGKQKEYYRCPRCFYETNRTNIIWPKERTQENNCKKKGKSNVQRLHNNNKRNKKT